MAEISRKVLMKSFGSHIDPGKDEELKSTKTDIDNKVAKITKHIKNRSRGKKDGMPRKDSELIEFIQDFHKQYQSLYVLYGSLVEVAREKVNGRDEKEGCSTYSSDSESYYSPDETGSRTSEGRTPRRSFKQKYETSNVEVAELRNKLTQMSMEKEGLSLEYMASSKKIQESEKMIEGLTLEVEHTKSLKEKLMAESRKLKEKLAEREKNLLTLAKTHQAQETKSSAQIKKLESLVTSLKHELQTLRIQKRGLEEQTERRANEAKKEEEENSGLKARILEHECKTIEEKDSLKNHVGDLELKVDTLRSQKIELEEQIRDKDNEIDQLRDENKAFSTRIFEMEKSLIERSSEISDMEKALIERSNELSAIETKLEGLKNDASNHDKSLLEQLNNLQQELDSLKTEKSLLESKIKKEREEYSESLAQMEKEHIELTSKIEEQQRTLRVQDDIFNKLNEVHSPVKGKRGSKLTFQIAERKIEDMAEEFRKKFEDNLRILSRRIRVAEQLHAENKECYVKLKERCEREHISVKEKVIITNELAQLAVKEAEILELRGKVLDLEKMVKESCEQERVSINEKVIINEVAEIDVKEAEILELRGKVLMLEKMVKEKEEDMLVVGEEKREAIRQLCLLIDYHRNRSDYAKKMLIMCVRGKRKI